MDTAAKETMGVKASRRVGEGEKVQGALKNECKGRSLSVRVCLACLTVYRECCAVKLWFTESAVLLSKLN